MANFSSTNLLPLIIVILLLETPNPGGATWWYMSQLPIQALALVHNGAICGNIPGLIGRQRRLCRTHPDVMISVIDGAKLGVQECQYQFRSNRWNCSTSEKDSSVFGKIMLKDKVGFGKDKRGSFEWGGCSDNVMYGSRFARKFVDARETDKRDARALMNMHNNRAGRRAVRKSRKLECKCHGVSGSCAIRTCWLAMHDFRQVGNMLRERYNGATQVMMDQTGTGLIVSHRNHKKPTRSDLVYFEASPDYCVQDPVTGSLGTAGRQCEKDSLRSDGCDIMCCGRGFDTRTVKRVRKCECKFHWCCYVKCKKCEEWKDIHTCKGPNPTVSPAIGSLARRPY